MWIFRGVALSHDDHSSTTYHKELNPVQLRISMSAVNVEAHNIVLYWANKNNVKIERSLPTDRPSILFTYRFNIDQDVIFFPVNEVNYLAACHLELEIRPGGSDYFIDDIIPYVKRIALLAASLEPGAVSNLVPALVANTILLHFLSPAKQDTDEYRGASFTSSKSYSSCLDHLLTYNTRTKIVRQYNAGNLQDYQQQYQASQRTRRYTISKSVLEMMMYGASASVASRSAALWQSGGMRTA